MRPQFWDPSAVTLIGGAQQRRGYKWASVYPIDSAVVNIFPPNNRACGIQNGSPANWRPGIWGSSSRHPGGVHILMGDGAVKFVTDSIEAGNSSNGMVRWNGSGPPTPNQFAASGSPSPYGLWGALSTSRSREVIDGEF